MPKYKITAPDGRQFILSGDKPPSQEVIDEAYANLPSLDTAQQTQPERVQQVQAQTEPTLMEKIRGISLKEVIKETPKQVVSDIARLAPYAALPFSAIGLAGQAGITGASRVIGGLAEGESVPQALKSGAIAAGTESANCQPWLSRLKHRCAGRRSRGCRR